MKYFFIVALLCASVFCFGQDTRTTAPVCGFYTQQGCIMHAAYLVHVNEDETVTGFDFTGGPGNWCYTMTITCNSIAATKVEVIKQIEKVIKSQECSLKEPSINTQYLK